LIRRKRKILTHAWGRQQHNGKGQRGGNPGAKGPRNHEIAGVAADMPLKRRLSGTSGAQTHGGECHHRGKTQETEYWPPLSLSRGKGGNCSLTCDAGAGGPTRKG